MKRPRPIAALGAILLEVTVSLVFVGLFIPPLIAAIHDALAETNSMVVLRQARLLAESKMAEIMQGIERDMSGHFEDENGDKIEGYEWKVEKKPVDFWPDPGDEPALPEDRDYRNLDDDTKDSLITLLEVTLTVTFPGQDEEMKAYNEETGKGLTLTMYRIPDEDDVTDLNLDYR